MSMDTRFGRRILGLRKSRGGRSFRRPPEYKKKAGTAGSRQSRPGSRFSGVRPDGLHGNLVPVHGLIGPAQHFLGGCVAAFFVFCDPRRGGNLFPWLQGIIRLQLCRFLLECADAFLRAFLGFAFPVSSEADAVDEAIFMERGWEFIGEGVIYYDELRSDRLGKRVGYFVKKYNDMKYNQVLPLEFVPTKHHLWWIPNSDMSANSALVQNPENKEDARYTHYKN